MKLRITRQLVIRESDGKALFLVAVYATSNVHPMLLQVIEPDDA